MPVLELQVASAAPLSVRRFVVREAISLPFDVSVVARSTDPSLDLATILAELIAERDTCRRISEERGMTLRELPASGDPKTAPHFEELLRS